MYCLYPSLTEVPEGQWLCDICDPVGSTAYLEDYVEQVARNRTQAGVRTPSDYQLYIEAITFPLDRWIPTMSSLGSQELDAGSLQILGNKIRLLTTTDKRYHIGRLLARRWDTELQRWEHLAHFKRSVPC